MEKSKYFGVSKVTSENCYCAVLCINGKQISLGKSKDQLKLAILYDDAVKKYGLNKRLNFPVYPENNIPNTRLVQLTLGYFAIVDEEDFERVNSRVWTVSLMGRKIKKPYAITHVYPEDNFDTNKRALSLQGFILNTFELLDHIDNNGLNNRKNNLRKANRSQNAVNKDRQTNRKNKYMGVKQLKGRYYARVNAYGVETSLGGYPTEIEAAKVRDKKVYEIFGEFARLNFPLQ